MTENDANPFTEALEEFDSDFSPFEQASVSAASAAQLQTIAEMNLVKPEVLAQLPRIASLTVKDLNDLADAFSGIPTNNQNVAELTLEDLKDIEDVFFEYKLAVGRDMLRPLRGGQGIGVADVSVSSCCSTPCSCCAAVDMTAS